ncbi:MAG: sodium-dependent transporter [Proteobacteria bacterium]|nr:sodium-dependent transporter [Pseudomonadota bacterium]
MPKTQTHESWTSRAAYIIVAIGATIGLGNLWRFPFAAGENGGGVFVLIYLFAVFFLVSPLFMAETLIGRLGRKSAPMSFKALREKYGGTGLWAGVGFLGLFISILVLSFFSVIAGFSIGYVFKALGGAFSTSDPAAVSALFREFTGNPYTLLLWHSVIAAMTALIVGRGIRSGIERAAKIMMPLLLLILIFLVVFASIIGDFGAAFRYLFTFQWEALSPQVALSAFGQAFFTMSVGSCGMLTYAAYVGKKIQIGKTTAIIAIGDTIVALLAGFAIFPIVFGYGLGMENAQNFVFTTLPIAFGQMPYGNLVAVLFFTLFVFAAVTSTIGLLETVVSYFIEKTRFSRPAIANALGVAFWAVGILSVLSFNLWSDVHPLGFIKIFAGMTPFALINGLVGNILLPIAGILISLFAGWVIPKGISIDELGLGKKIYFNIWLFVVRFIVPAGVLALLLTNLFLAGG